MFTKEDVARQGTEFGALKVEPACEVEVSQFGLKAVALDPVSGKLITLAQPAIADVGQVEILLTAKQAVEAVASARRNHLHNVRAQGYFSIEDYNESQKRNAASRELAHKQEMEKDALDATHAEASAKAAAAAQPKKVPVVEERKPGPVS